MKNRSSTISLWLLLTFCSAVLSASVPATDPNVQFWGGRIDWSTSLPRFDWSGGQVFALFNGTSFGIQLSESSTNNAYQVWIDGVELEHIFTNQGVNDLQLASGLDDRIHNFSMIKRTEAQNGPVTVLSFTLDDGCGFLTPPPLPTRRIEFIGDSITCGYGAFGNRTTDSTCDGFDREFEDSYWSWAKQTERMWGDAETHLVSWSCKGVVRNCDGTTTWLMPWYYNLTLGSDPSIFWDFSSWVPDLVVINLGTNDGGVPPAAEFQAGYHNFLASIREYYNNITLPFFLACGPMSTAECQNIVEVVETEYAKFGNVFYLNLWNMTSCEGENMGAMQPDGPSLGCQGHPDVHAHNLMANQTAYLAQCKFGWEYEQIPLPSDSDYYGY